MYTSKHRSEHMELDMHTIPDTWHRILRTPLKADFTPTRLGIVVLAWPAVRYRLTPGGLGNVGVQDLVLEFRVGMYRS